MYFTFKFGEVNSHTDSFFDQIISDGSVGDKFKDFNIVREFLYFEGEMKNFQIKYLLPRYQIKNYNIYTAEELDLALIEVKNFLERILENKELLNQIDEIISIDFEHYDKS